MNEPTMTVREGGCLCGAVRFRAEGAPQHVCYCHCEMCRRATGAPVAAFATYETARVAWTRRAPRWRQSSALARRAFCADCGSAMCWQGAEDRAHIDLAIGCFDDAADLAPADHLWDGSRIAWFHVADTLPRYARERKK
ncbi:MAG: GFA family protein [Rhodospirillaceae bacterium]|nr:GFA family protein [Rhodospirillaceae bacterium]